MNDTADNNTGQRGAGSDPGIRRPSLGLTLAAPALLLPLPSRLGRVLRNAGAGAIVATALSYLLLFAISLVGLAIYEDTVRWVWTNLPTPPTTAPTSASAPVQAPPYEVQYRTPAQVWADAHAQYYVSELEIIGIVAFLTAMGALVVYAWLQLPRMHGCGEIRRTFGRCLRGSIALVLPATLVMLLYGSTIIGRDHMYRTGSAPFPPPMGFYLLINSDIGPAFAGLVIIAVLTWSGRAMRAAAADDTPLELPDRCEGCGYDLTMQPPDGRCPECARPVATSIGPGTVRRGVVWPQQRSPTAFFATIRDVISQPTEFYRRLRVRTEHRTAERFALLVYALAGVGALIWLFTIHSIEFGLSRTIDLILDLRGDLAGISLAALTIGPLTLYAGHRVGAAIVTTWWLVRGFVPDTRWTWKIICYEAAWVWVYCGCWGALITTFMFWPDWPVELSYLLGMQRPWPTPFVGAMLVLMATAGLSLIWLLRYERAGRAVRWSNF